MKTELRLAKHINNIDEAVIEVWHDGKFIATIYGSDSPGIRIISKFEKQYVVRQMMVVEVLIDPLKLES